MELRTISQKADNKDLDLSTKSSERNARLWQEIHAPGGVQKAKLSRCQSCPILTTTCMFHYSLQTALNKYSDSKNYQNNRASI